MKGKQVKRLYTEQDLRKAFKAGETLGENAFYNSDYAGSETAEKPLVGFEEWLTKYHKNIQRRKHERSRRQDKG